MSLVLMYRAACLILWLCCPQRFSWLGKAWFVIFFSKLALMKYLAVWCLSVSKNLFFQIIRLHTYSARAKLCVKRISVCYHANYSRLGLFYYVRLIVT